ncbi:MAG: hypothetical protein QOF35_2164, partial [Actinomycetota bacterium]|nr:hypothetical protein [Actinomycetota bacterium]
ADQVAAASGLPASAVPDLGPETLMDQLAVMVYDVAHPDPAHHDPAHQDLAHHDPAHHDPAAMDRTTTLAQDLASLRRDLP